MRAVAPVAAMAVLLAASPCYAFDAAQADIIGLRLGMADSEVAAALRSQGFEVINAHGALTARTFDGQLIVDLSDAHEVREIRYTLTRAGAGEMKEIQASILDRFGPPQQTNPMAWCRAIGRDGICPATGASLTYRPDKLTLVLRAGTVPSE